MRRGELWWARLRPPRGSAPGYDRPVVVVQSDLLNDTAIGTSLCVAVTSNLRLVRSEGNVALGVRESRLPKDSVVNVTAVLTVDNSDLTARITTLSAKTLRLIDEGLRFALDL